MAGAISNDNDAGAAAALTDSAASGLAAILLVESLIHGLVDRGLVTVNEAIDIVATAEDVARDTVGENLGPRPTLDRALQILTSIGVSLQIDAT